MFISSKMNNPRSVSPALAPRGRGNGERRMSVAGNAKTAVPVLFPTHALKVSDFLLLRPGERVTHQKLVADGLVSEWSMEMGPLAFVSHQWCGWDHPDSNFEQLGLLQTCLRRIANVSLERGERQLRAVFRAAAEGNDCLTTARCQSRATAGIPPSSATVAHPATFVPCLLACLLA